ncbi:MAG: FAD-dependent oxidoreductase, partial [Chloroflexi bacterium]|nr:FAD-dependent oxidoreductase [Chloroflexota bacterium]
MSSRPDTFSSTAKADVVVVGGGIAGLSTALRLSEHGLAVTLVERREVLGGRASSFRLRAGDEDSPGHAHPRSNGTEEPANHQAPAGGDGSAEWVDNCQHVLMRCCVNLLDLYRRIGAEDDIEFYDRFLFVDPQGRRSTLSASRWLPAPLHLIPSLLRFQSMGAADKWGISFAMFRLLMIGREQLNDHTVSFGEWLRQTRQTRNAVECFWRPVVVSALNEEPETTAAPYAFQLFRRAFLSNRRAFEMGLPAGELADIYSRAGGAALAANDVRVISGRRVSNVLIRQGITCGVIVGEDTIEAGAVVIAAPPHVVPSLLDT